MEKHDEPISRKQIAKEIGYDIKEESQLVKVSHALKKLLKKKEIKCIELDRIQAGIKLGLGKPFRRTRFYYL